MAKIEAFIVIHVMKYTEQAASKVFYLLTFACINIYILKILTNLYVLNNLTQICLHNWTNIQYSIGSGLRRESIYTKPHFIPSFSL